MAIERRLARDMFNENAIVELRQVCMTPSGFFQPGKYLVGQLPDAAFEMGLVEALPPRPWQKRRNCAPHRFTRFLTFSPYL